MFVPLRRLYRGIRGSCHASHICRRPQLCHPPCPIHPNHVHTHQNALLTNFIACPQASPCPIITAPTPANKYKPTPFRPAPFGTAAGASLELARAEVEVEYETLASGESALLVEEVVIEGELEEVVEEDTAANDDDGCSVEAEFGLPPGVDDATEGASAVLDGAGVLEATGVAGTDD